MLFALLQRRIKLLWYRAKEDLNLDKKYPVDSRELARQDFQKSMISKAGKQQGDTFTFL